MRPANETRSFADTVERFFATLLFFIAMLGLLTSCVVVRVEQAEKRLQKMIASLPEPPNAVLLDEMADVGYGSDEACYTAYLVRLYGTNQSPAEVLSFYEDTLLSKGEWEKIENLSNTQHLTFYNRKDGFRLSINHNMKAYTNFTDQSIAEAQKQFDSPFIIGADHADTATRNKCWVGWGE